MQTETEHALVLGDPRTWHIGQDACLHRLFEAQARRTPNAIAVVCETRQLTYQDLNRRANQLANDLRKRGVGIESLVGVSVERSLEMVISVLATLKAGAAYVPLDPSYPEARTQFVLSDSNPAVVITHKSLRRTLPKQFDRISLDRDQNSFLSNPDEDLTDVAITSSNLAYVIYTSGSTGKPKGVAIEHGSALNLLASVRKEPGLTAGDVLVAVSTLSFDIAVVDIFLPLITGARLVIATSETARDGAALKRLLDDSQATIMQATPSTWRMLIEAGWQPSNDFKILCTGETMPLPLGQELTRRSHSVWNLYGPTETTIWSSIYKLNGREKGQIPIGRPVANTQIYILDGDLKPVPTGTAGDIYIAGTGLARGYLNQPEMTAEKFLPNPFSPDFFPRMYKTGDLGRWTHTGNIEYLGRADQQIKLRGFRIELGEIDATLSHHPSISAALTVVQEDTGDKRLVGYVIAKDDQPISSESLTVHLKRTLPDYMVPAQFVVLNQFPLLPNGKIDRAALPAPEKYRPAKRTLPRNKIETQLIAIWQDVLQTSDVTPHDNFFELGGHSFLAVRLFSQIERIFGQRFPLATLFNAPTVKELALIVSKNTQDRPWSSLVTLQTGQSALSLFLIPGVGGDVLGFGDLARLIGREVSVYGLQSRGLDGREKPLETVEDIAAQFVKEIRLVQKAGPYFLGGTCMGGIVAFEIAQQLIAAGEHIAFLGLMDTFPPSAIRRSIQKQRLSMPRLFDPAVFLARRVSHHAREALKLGPKYWSSQISHGLRAAKDMLSQEDVYRGDRLIFLRSLVSETNLRAAAQYVPKPYPNRITFFSASERRIPASGDSRLIWRNLATSGFVVCPISTADSGSMIKRPAVGMLAERLKASIDEEFRRTGNV